MAGVSSTGPVRAVMRGPVRVAGDDSANCPAVRKRVVGLVVAGGEGWRVRREREQKIFASPTLHQVSAVTLN